MSVVDMAWQIAVRAKGRLTAKAREELKSVETSPSPIQQVRPKLLKARGGRNMLRSEMLPMPKTAMDL